MNPRIFFVLTAAFFFFAFAVHAEFYQYTDQSGVVHYTDDYSTIPEQFRPQASAISQVPKDLSPPQADQSQSLDASEINTGSTGDQADNLQGKRKELVKRQETLHQQYKILLNEKEKLEARGGELSKKSEVQAYNKQVRQLKEKIKTYQEKVSALESEIQKYNKRIQEQ